MSTLWYPHTRDGQIRMVERWFEVFEAKPFGIPLALRAELRKLLDSARKILDLVKNVERSPVGTAACDEAFREMEGAARYLKKRYLTMPPLEAADFEALLLPLPGELWPPPPPPEGRPELTVSYPGGPCLVTVRWDPSPGTEPLVPGWEYGCALYRGVMPPGGASLEEAAGLRRYLMRPPRGGEELLYHRFTRRREEAVSFAPEESGMIAFFCGRYETQGGAVGEWGSVAQAVIT